jgi:Sulfotransferase domain
MNEIARRPRGRPPDFIGLGAQRASTSWIYACLYEHPEICMPMKEVNFFSRERYWGRGLTWYEGLFRGCRQTSKVGELSTSYLANEKVPDRIHRLYPGARLFVCLRHPVDRAYSSYLNDLTSGVVPPDTGFWEAFREHPEYVLDGQYARHLTAYLRLFPQDQVLILIFDDARRDPARFMATLYRFLGVDPGFRPSMLERRVGWGRVPRSVGLDRTIVRTSGFLRRHGLGSIWWLVKRIGLGDLVRAVNTRNEAPPDGRLSPADRRRLVGEFESDLGALEVLLGRQLEEWRT